MKYITCHFCPSEKARLQAEARAAEEARRKAEAEAAAEAKRKRELEREAARLALQKVRLSKWYFVVCLEIYALILYSWGQKNLIHLPRFYFLRPSNTQFVTEIYMLTIFKTLMFLLDCCITSIPSL